MSFFGLKCVGLFYMYYWFCLGNYKGYGYIGNEVFCFFVMNYGCYYNCFNFFI